MNQISILYYVDPPHTGKGFDTYTHFFFHIIFTQFLFHLPLLNSTAEVSLLHTCTYFSVWSIKLIPTGKSFASFGSPFVLIKSDVGPYNGKCCLHTSPPSHLEKYKNKREIND